jgi:hypothetical protein
MWNIIDRSFWVVLAAAAIVAAPSNAATTNPLAKWFGSQTCPALDGLSSKKTPPAVKTGTDDLIVNVPASVLPLLSPSMTVPWYVYDPHTQTAYSHIGGDSGVVQTLRLVGGPPPHAVPTVDLSGAHTQSGIKLGDSAASVLRTLGKPLIINACGMQRYEYNDTNVKGAEPNDLDFTIKDGRVIEIMHTVDG